MAAQKIAEGTTAGATMTDSQRDDGCSRERLRELTAKIATEQDPDKFTALVQELNQLLDGEKQKRHKTADA